MESVQKASIAYDHLISKSIIFSGCFAALDF